MLYLNIQTEQRTKEFISDDITIPIDDIRVSPFFQPVPPKKDGIGYKRDKDVNGLPIFKEYQLDENNEFYPHYLKDGTPDLAKINAIKLKQSITTWKKDRQQKVDNIEVTYNNIVYQGDETSQSRMTKAITALPDDTTTIPWTAKDNSTQSLTRADLKAILLDAGTQQSKIWNEGRPE